MNQPCASPKKINRKPPKWEWEGVYECPECGEGVDFFQEEGYAEVARILESNNWVAQVFHHHGNPDWPEGRWQLAFYERYKGRQRPKIRKDAEEQHREAYKKKRQEREIANRSS